MIIFVIIIIIIAIIIAISPDLSINWTVVRVMPE